MALKVGDVCILPGEEATLEELASIVEVSTDPKMKILAEIKADEMKEKAEARKKAKESFAPEYVWDPYQKRPCCVCPPCAIFGPCIDDMIHPDFPGSALFCFPCQMVCGKLTHPVCIGHCKFFQLCDCCVNCRCSCCPPSCTCCNITCPPACLYNCCKIPSCCSLPKCSCCPPSCEWCGVKCPPTCCSLPKCLNCCPPTCKWCGIQCPPQCLLDCLSFCLSCKAVGCAGLTRKPFIALPKPAHHARLR